MSRGSEALASIMNIKHGNTSHQRGCELDGAFSTVFTLFKSIGLELNSVSFDIANRGRRRGAVGDADWYGTATLSSSIGAASRYFRVDMSIYATYKT